MSKPLRFAMIMSTEVGLRTQYLSWRNHFPTDIGIEPTWIVTDEFGDHKFIEKLPLPMSIRSRILAQTVVSQALAAGPYDATFVAVHSALIQRPDYVRRNACFMTFDVTPKQLHDFGDFYGKYPSRFETVEQWKHEARTVAYKECRRLFPWSHWAAESAVHDYGSQADRIRINPPGVDLSQWTPTKPNPSKITCDLLFVGGHFDRKGGPLLLEWAKTTKATDWRLHIVTREAVETTDERIHVYNDLNSNDPKLVELYKTADVFVLPTRADCYSIAGIEAMASGLPVILSATGGTPDVINDGVTGYLTQPGDVPSLTLRLEELIESPELRRTMGEAARADAEERYDVRKNVRYALTQMKEAL